MREDSYINIYQYYSNSLNGTRYENTSNNSLNYYTTGVIVNEFEYVPRNSGDQYWYTNYALVASSFGKYNGIVFDLENNAKYQLCYQ